MHAYLFIGNNKENIDKQISTFFPNILGQISNQTITKIEDVRNLRKHLKLTQSALTYIKIEDIDSSTIEAQNAFLKNLEEPPSNIIFILTAHSETTLLPTILSRCQVIKSTNLFEYPKKELADFFAKEVCERTLYLGKIQKKNDALKFITYVIYYFHDKLKSEDQAKGNYLRFLKAAGVALFNIKSNGNVFLQLLNFSIATK